MNEKNGMILAVMAVAIIAIAGVGVYVATHSNDGYAEPTGIWYQTGYYGYYDGNYHSSDDRDAVIYDYDLIITEIKNEVFYGLYSDSLITGSIVDNIISFYGTFGDYEVWFYGHYDGNSIRAVSTENGTDHKSHYLVYDRDLNARASNLSSVDLTGDWQTITAKAYGHGIETELEGTDLSIDGQTGCAFYGYMDQMIDENIKNVYFCGSFMDLTVNGYTMGYILDGEGRNWTILANDDRIVLRTNTENDSGIGNGDINAVERIYSRDGTGEDDADYDVGLSGTTWRSKTTSSADYNKLYERYIEYSIAFECQSGPLLNGTIEYNGYTYDMCAYIYSTSPLLIGFSALENKYSIRGTLAVDDDVLRLIEWYDEGLSTDVTYFNLDDGKDVMPNDISGIWYCVRSLGRATDGTSFVNNISYGDMRYIHNLKIISAENGLFSGYYNQTFIAGTYQNDRISFNAELDNGDRIMFSGTFMSDSIIDSNTIYYDSEKNIYLAYRSIYSDRLIEAWVSNISTDMYGNWESPTGYSVMMDDDGITFLNGKVISISVKQTVLYGTMEQEVNGKLAVKDFVGTLVNGDDMAFIVDDTGLVYAATLSNDILYLRTISNTDTGDIGEQVVAERIYTSNGDEPSDIEFTDLKGRTWTSSSFDYMDTEGNIGSYGDLKIEITEQYNDMFRGIATLNDTAYDLCGFIITDADGLTIICISLFGSQIFTGETVYIHEDTMHIFGSMNENGDPMAYKAVLI